MIYFSSDLHFGHDQSFLWKPRGFSSIDQHDVEIIKRWNEIVSPEDEVYILGDLMLNDNIHGMECIAKLNGKLHIVRGNHDSDARWKLYSEASNIVELCDWSHMLRYGKRYFYLSHWPVRIGNEEENHGPHCLHGHTHSQNRYEYFEERCYNIGLDAHNSYPISIEQVMKDIKEKNNESRN